VTIAPNGDAKIYDVTGALDQKKLDAAARKLFGNDLSMGALVLAKVYGGAGQSQNDLQMAFKVSRQTRMFDMARKFMAQNSTRMQGGASEEPTGNKPTASDLYNSGR
jgi:predicted alpha/beta-fold hydrolase